VETCSRIPTAETQTVLLKSEGTFHSIPKCNIASLGPFRTDLNINVTHNNRPSVIESCDCLHLQLE